ncbi:hypothetical protein HPP92_004181 [Vanilla planifolia]|uniref:DNA mismatch repair protein S5 domain-containing protein n=1 Tax=Vanilla planifolia TaxID=51239 RepID=A0A835RWV0_VANPL|nr:hypothetical protein HPP92_004181 [Vanilla planifolia]
MEIDDPVLSVLPVAEAQAHFCEPPRIQRLDESVVNRIAAGEVVQRPASAVKELVENSIDAGASTISVVVKDGGLKLIQVSDNGHGIRYEDLPILCERHTTSKLTTYDDLQTIKTMGFRGEALASMTYVGHVTVTTITDGQLHGYRVSYRDGVMEHEPKPCAAVKGTQIMVENLFYNMIARRKTLQNSNDDYPKIVDLISRFAIHHTNVSFTCRKHGANKPDVHTMASATRLDAIKMVYGASVAHRLVECTPLKRAIEVAYSATLPKASKPFIFMSIRLPPEHVDVNVHPTKREVSLLNQENLVNTIQDAVESKLMTSNNTRTFNMQSVNSTTMSTFRWKKDTQESPTVTKFQKVPIQKMVRIDSRDPSGRLHAYLQDRVGSQNDKKLDLTSVRNAVRLRRNPKEASDLTSIQELLRDIDFNVHSGGRLGFSGDENDDFMKKIAEKD